MLIYAGIDEAGYGPMFGPFIIARTVFSIAHLNDPLLPPDLWKLMTTAVCRKASDRKRRIPIGDSKKLYTPAAGVKHLERATLAFSLLLDKQPDCFDQWLQLIAADGESAVPDRLWYMHEFDEALVTPPTTASWDEIKLASAVIQRAAKASNLQIEDMAAHIIYESRYNELVAKTRSKASLAWLYISKHLDHIWRESGHHPVVVVVDRQGGRSKYLRQLQISFPDAAIRILDEGAVLSRYELTIGKKRMIVSFEVEADSNHLPTALASMCAKYNRELLMKKFNAYFQRHLPELKPTAGYVQDGRRFMKQIEPLLDQLGLSKEQLIRSK